MTIQRLAGTSQWMLEELAAELAGAHGSGLGEIGLQAVADLHGGVARAEDAFARAPVEHCRRQAAEELFHLAYQVVVKADETESAFIGVEFGGEFVKAGEALEVGALQVGLGNLDCVKDALGDRLRSHTRQDSAPVEERELEHRDDRDGEQHGGEHASTST